MRSHEGGGRVDLGQIPSICLITTIMPFLISFTVDRPRVRRARFITLFENAMSISLFCYREVSEIYAQLIYAADLCRFCG